MKRVSISSFGVDNLQVLEVNDAVAGPGEILIQADAATINPADFGVISGATAGGFPPSFQPPYTPGWDVAGHVVAVGDGVDASWVGERVVGFSLWFATSVGTQAGLVALPVENVAKAPDILPAEQLTTVGLNGLTAWRAVDELDPQVGETIVVGGAGGSVGGYALQLIIARGARVIAAVSAKDGDKVRSLGASDVAAREDGPVGPSVRALIAAGADGFLDTASIGAPALDAVRDGGRYVTTTAPVESARNIRTANIYGVPDAEALATLVQMASDGQLDTPVAMTFDVTDAAAAYREFAAGGHSGRIVLTFGK